MTEQRVTEQRVTEPSSAACETVRVERDGPVFTITIVRPERRNAVDGPTAVGLAAALREFESDATALVAVLTGDGGTFCAGADLKAIHEGAGNRLAPDGDGPMGPSRMMCSKPVIAAVEGYAVAGGLELAIWCDMRVVAADAVFGVFCRRWGVPLIDGGTIRLPRLIGQSRALDMILTGRPVAADEALLMGLANRVVPSGEALQAAQLLALEIAAFPQACLRADRSSAYAAFDGTVEDGLRREFTGGVPVVALEALAGSKRFADGAGRGGSFE